MRYRARFVALTLASTFATTTQALFWQSASSQVRAATATVTPVGTAECSGIRVGSPASTRPIQKATLEPREGGYTLKFTEIYQDGQQRESQLELNNQLQVQSARTLGAQGGEWKSVVFRGTPVKIQPTGAFSVSMMVTTRSTCTFSGTLQFAGNAQAQLFPGSSTQAGNPSRPAPSAAKIAEGVYWVGATGMVLEVKGQQYQYRDEESTTRWKPISELTHIKDGVIKAGETYWCLSTLPHEQLAVCSASGWTISPSIRHLQKLSKPFQYRI